MAKRFLWFQWDISGQTLYYVYLKPNQKEQMSRIEYMLRAVSFGEDGKPEIQLDVPINIRLSRNLTEDSEYLHLPCCRTVPDINFHMEIVRIDPNSSCICLQRFATKEANHPEPPNPRKSLIFLIVSFVVWMIILTLLTLL